MKVYVMLSELVLENREINLRFLWSPSLNQDYTSSSKFPSFAFAAPQSYASICTETITEATTRNTMTGPRVVSTLIKRRQ